MLNFASSLFHPLLLKLDPETAHQATVFSLKQMGKMRKMTGCALPIHNKRLEISAFGHTFPNPLGLAAGFDKQAEVIDPLLGLGFGFVEAGGVTPVAQDGNPRPRVFRLPEDGAVINRYGLNSEGLERVAQRLEMRQHQSGIVGINIGANKESANREQDYVICMQRLAGLTAFATINVSSPNTPGLRDLQGEEAMRSIISRTIEARDTAIAHGKKRTAVLLKIAPDMAFSTLDDLLETAIACGIDGLIIANTTVSRPKTLQNTGVAQETGGLSGRPLFDLSTKMLAHAYEHVGQRIPLIGVGGVESGETAWRKIEAGATLIQLYTALIYQGPALVQRILDYIVQRMECENIASLTSVIGRGHQKT